MGSYIRLHLGDVANVLKEIDIPWVTRQYFVFEGVSKCFQTK